MQVTTPEWTKTEEDVAKKAFEIAYKREIDSLISSVHHQIESLVEVDDMWRLHDFLSVKRHEIDGRYDFQLAILVFVFADLVKTGLLKIDELQGLSTDKIAKIAALACM
jgi:hypothetical protein